MCPSQVVQFGRLTEFGRWAKSPSPPYSISSAFLASDTGLLEGKGDKRKICILLTGQWIQSLQCYYSESFNEIHWLYSQDIQKWEVMIAMLE